MTLVGGGSELSGRMIAAPISPSCWVRETRLGVLWMYMHTTAITVSLSDDG